MPLLSNPFYDDGLAQMHHRLPRKEINPSIFLGNKSSGKYIEVCSREIESLDPQSARKQVAALRDLGLGKRRTA